MRDIGYMAQRSSNPKAVLNFLNALPPGTLESGVDDIPLDEVRKRFKLRSPKMTKALVRLGVHPDVVAGYYAGFANRDAEPRVYHMTTFPHPEIMRQQSASKHFSSCMYDGSLHKHKTESMGAYYDDCIHDDIEAYQENNLGLLVVGSHANTINEYLGNDEGFLMRAKFRLMYSSVDDALVCILVDRVYGQQPLLMKALKTLLSWSSIHYPNIPIIASNKYFCSFTDADTLRVNGNLYYPHEGYHDTLFQSGGLAILRDARCTKFVVVTPGLLESNLLSAQLKVYKTYRKERELWESFLPKELYVNRGTDSISRLSGCAENAKYSRRPRTRYEIERCKRLGVFNTRFVNLLKVLQFEHSSLFDCGFCDSGIVSLGNHWNLNIRYRENRYTGYRDLDVTMTNNKGAYYYCVMSGHYEDNEGKLSVRRDAVENLSAIQDKVLITAIKSVIELIIDMVYLEPIDKTKPKSYNSGVAYLRRMHEQIQQLRYCTERLKKLQ